MEKCGQVLKSSVEPSSLRSEIYGENNEKNDCPMFLSYTKKLKLYDILIPRLGNLKKVVHLCVTKHLIALKYDDCFLQRFIQINRSQSWFILFYSLYLDSSFDYGPRRKIATGSGTWQLKHYRHT